MVKLLINKFISGKDDISNPRVRKKYGSLSGILGIIFNILLFGAKLSVGIVTNSIAVISDAFNNLSDMGSSFVSVFGANMSGKEADKEHPYGHGRAEYIASLVIAFLIIFFGFELIKSSFLKIFEPANLELGAVSVVILILSVLVKLYMWAYNRYIGKKIKSDMILAVSKDSLFDAVATTLITLAAIVSPYFDFPVDAIAGMVVSGLIIYTGIKIAWETINILLGTGPDEEISENIEKIIKEEKSVLGSHDLLIHDYGPGRIIASVHIEVYDDLTLIEVHDMIDALEKRILNEYGVDIVIHADPIKRIKF